MEKFIIVWEVTNHDRKAYISESCLHFFSLTLVKQYSYSYSFKNATLSNQIECKSWGASQLD